MSICPYKYFHDAPNAPCEDPKFSNDSMMVLWIDVTNDVKL